MNETNNVSTTIIGMTHIIQKYRSILTNNATDVPMIEANTGLGIVTTIL